MASLLIRNVDPELHARLKARAAEHRRSLEEEVRELLRIAVARPSLPGESLLALADRLFGPEHGVDLDVPSRSLGDDRPVPDFADPELQS